MTEEQLLEKLNTLEDYGFTSTNKDPYCRWDAESDKYLAELKCRRAHYTTQLIEHPKLEYCTEEAEKSGKEFLYCVNTPEGTYIFNVSKLLKEGYDFQWETRKMPNKTMFGQWEKVDKKVGYIDVNTAQLFSSSVPEAQPS